MWLLLLLLLTPTTSALIHLNATSNIKANELKFNLLYRDQKDSPFRVKWNSTFEEMQYYLIKGVRRLNYMSNKMSNSNKPLKKSYPTASGKYNIEITVNNEVPDHAEYFLDFYISDDELYQYVIYDTGSDLTWIQCSECTSCFQPVGDTYSINSSPSSAIYPCSDCDFDGVRTGCSSGNCMFSYGYVDGSKLQGIMGTDSFTFKQYNSNRYLTITDTTFGCATFSSGFGGSLGGIAGFGIGAVSFPSQFRGIFGRNAFSSCLVRNRLTSTSKLLMGSPAVAPSGIAYTPILTNPYVYSNGFYVQVTRVAVGSKALSIPSSAWSFSQSNKYGGTIIDSGTTLTYLVRSALNPILNEIVKQMSGRLQRVSDTRGYSPCYSLSQASFSQLDLVKYFPTITFTFKNNVNVKLLGYHYIRWISFSTVCSTFQPSSESFNLIGHFFQQDFLVVHDVQSMRLGFKAVDCSTGRSR